MILSFPAVEKLSISFPAVVTICTILCIRSKWKDEVNEKLSSLFRLLLQYVQYCVLGPSGKMK